MPGMDGLDDERRLLEKRAQRRIGKGLAAQLAAALPEGTTEDTVSGADLRAIAASGPLRDGLYASLVEGVLLGVDVGRRQTEARQGVGKDAGIGVDWTLVNAEAREWARFYAGQLVTGLDETTAKALRQALAEWIQNSLTYDELLKEIGEAFGPERAARIAETEITRAYAEGNRKAWKDGGVITEMVWRTANDERVCPECGALDGQIVAVEGGEFVHPGGEGREKLWGRTYNQPPAHPRCRCWIVPETRR